MDDDEAAAAVIIPAGFTASIIPAEGVAPRPASRTIELYTNPTRPTSVGVIKTIVEEFLSQVEVGRVGGQVAVTQLLEQRADPAPRMPRGSASEVGARQADAAREQSAITLKSNASGGEAVDVRHRWPTWRPAWR